jgi:N-formylmaleamate deformylase
MKKSENTYQNGRISITLLFALFLSFSAISKPQYSFNVIKKGQGAPLIFIPGLITSGEVWHETMEHFSKTNECHVLTLAGYAGQPPLADAPYLESFKKEIIHYIDEQKLNNVVLVGHSIGGYISLMIGLENHPSIRKLVILDAMPHFAAEINPNAKEGFDEASAKQYMASFEAFDQEQIKNYRLTMAKSMTKNQEKWNDLVEWSMSSDLKTEAYSSHEMLATDLRKDIAKIEAPILVLAAFDYNEMYPQYTLEAATATYKSQYQHANMLQLEIAEGSKHFIMWDKPEWIFEKITQFIQ